MTTPVVDALLFRLGDHRLAVDLQLVSSVLDPDDAEGMRQLDPRLHLTSQKENTRELLEAGKDGLVGLLDIDGPPTGVLLGEVLGAKTLTPADLLVLPDWLAEHLPPVFVPAIARIDQKVVWLLDLDKLNN